MRVFILESLGFIDYNGSDNFMLGNISVKSVNEIDSLCKIEVLVNSEQYTIAIDDVIYLESFPNDPIVSGEVKIIKITSSAPDYFEISAIDCHGMQLIFRPFEIFSIYTKGNNISKEKAIKYAEIKREEIKKEWEETKRKRDEFLNSTEYKDKSNREAIIQALKLREEGWPQERLPNYLRIDSYDKTDINKYEEILKKNHGTGDISSLLLW